MHYLVVVEPGRIGWGAHVPDVPGCVAAADSRDEVIELIDAHRHISGLRARHSRSRRRRRAAGSCPSIRPGQGAGEVDAVVAATLKPAMGMLPARHYVSSTQFINEVLGEIQLVEQA